MSDNIDKKQLLKAFKAMANDSRLRILIMLGEPEKHFPDAQSDLSTQGVCLGLIAKTLGFSPSTISSYMNKLEEAGLVESLRQGQWTFYKLCPAAITKIAITLQQLINGEKI